MEREAPANHPNISWMQVFHADRTKLILTPEEAKFKEQQDMAHAGQARVFSNEQPCNSDRNARAQEIYQVIVQ